jgi:hypothetical protein
LFSLTFVNAITNIITVSAVSSLFLDFFFGLYFDGKSEGVASLDREPQRNAPLASQNVAQERGAAANFTRCSGQRPAARINSVLQIICEFLSHASDYPHQKTIVNGKPAREENDH